MTTEPKSVVTCLMVDDRQENLVALDLLLRNQGVVLLKARSGVEALELLLVHEIALALIDVQMPEMDGFELAELMRGSERTRGVPIIFLTADTSNQQRRFRGYEAGAVDFLQKPIEGEILKSKVGVFFDLYRQRLEVARQRDENKLLLAESRQYSLALQDADRRKDEFLATLAHELRNPLAPILNAMQLLKLTDDVPLEVQEVHEIVERQVEHMVRLVDDLLEISRITSGKIQLQKEPISLATVFRNAIETSQPLLESGKHSFDLSMPPESLVVDGDLVRLTQVIANLLNNAAKYTPEGGSIALSVEKQSSCVHITVSDTGLGIPAEMIGRVFDMFTQINRHLKRAQGGLGIGLALVKRLVNLHGGTVSVVSGGEGKGSAFTIILPLSINNSSPMLVGEADNAIVAETLRVLLIDDNEDALRCLKLLVSKQGHEVQTASTGIEGVVRFAEFRPTIAFIDIGMPDIDGFETARRIRNTANGESALLVALTGWGQDEDRQKSRDAGFNFHFVKPLSSEKLEELFAKTTGL